MKHKMTLFFLLGLWLPLAQAYPWMFFREESSPKVLELDLNFSYFLKQDSISFVGLKLDYNNPYLKLDVAYNYSISENQNYFRLSELALVFPLISEEWKMILGFKDTLWSETDKYWNHGLWQPRYILDAFRPVQMSLPGLYLSYQGDTSFLLLLSSFYLPDIVVSPQLKDRRVFSENPFFVDGFDRFLWDIDELEPVRLNRFFQRFLALQLRHDIENANMSLSYAYKPANQLQYSVFFKGKDLSGTSEDKFILSDLKYSVLYHHLVSLEGEATLAEKMSLFLSLFYEKPTSEELGEGWISDDFESHLTLSALLYFKENMGENSKTLFTLGWTKTLETRAEGETSNNITEDLEEVFNRGILWKHALSASVEYQDKSLLDGFLFRVRGNYALDNNFYAMALENHLSLTPQASLYVSGDVIFRLSERPEKRYTSSISKYKDLSRLLVGVKYAF